MYIPVQIRTTLMYMGVQTGINLLLPPEMLARIDRARGRVPRLVWIRDAIEERLAGGEVVARPVPESPPRRRTIETVRPAVLAADAPFGPEPLRSDHPFRPGKSSAFRCAECGLRPGQH